MRIGIVGYGVVGSAIARLFSRSTALEVCIYDKYKPSCNSAAHKDQVNRCDLAFVCVPTPMLLSGDCDTSQVDECVAWLDVPICIRSTVVPGTVERLVAATGKAICFSPEYIGEQASHPWAEEGACGFMIVGGTHGVCDIVKAAYSKVGSLQLVWHETGARTAELCKYMENSFLATKVAFVNQYYDIAKALHVDFEELRMLWLADSRVGESHTRVTPERGFGGKCLPKDLAAIITLMGLYGGAPLLETVQQFNEKVRAQSGQESVTPKVDMALA